MVKPHDVMQDKPTDPQSQSVTQNAGTVAKEPELPGPGRTIGWILAASGLVICLAVSYHYQSVLYLMLTVAGGAIGWLIGILISPTEPGQSEVFAAYGKALFTFISGFVLAKLDRVFEIFLSSKPDLSQAEMVAIPTLLFITMLVLGTLTTFAGRDFGVGGLAARLKRR
jgi:hypothetical protein